MKRITVILLFSLVFIGVFAQIERVEPAFWWVGMKNPNLQLLIHGNGISNYAVQTNKEGVRIIKVNKVTNPNYLFINLFIDPQASPGKFNLTFSPARGKPFSCPYELKVRRNGSAGRQGFTSSDVVYLLMPDRFANGDTTNDNVASQPDRANRALDYGRHGGDIKGIIDHLDYIKELGATAIWATPLLENNHTKYTYHGYAISDYYKIDPRFGSNDDYCKMVETAHEKGIKVIMDMVSNHCGIGHWWMKDLPTDDWIHRWDTFTRSNYKMSTIVDIHAAAVDKKQFLDGWFDTSMPDMNQQNPFFWRYFIQNSIWWIEYANLDGIRMDTYPYNDRDAMAQWAKEITDEYADFNIVGETWSSNPVDVAFWQKDAVNPVHYNSQLPTVMDFTLYDALSNCFNERQEHSYNGLMKLYNAIAYDYLYANPDNLFIFAENHDTQRFNNIIKGDLATFKLAMSFLMTTRGIPQIYYGTEIGMTGDKSKGDGDIRRDFPGGWAGDANNAFTKAGRTSVQNDCFDFLSKLLNWRKGKEVIHTGKLTHFIPEKDVYVYFRYNDNEKIMVVLNNTITDQTIPTGRFAECIGKSTAGIDAMTGTRYSIANALLIPKKTALILELE